MRRFYKSAARAVLFAGIAANLGCSGNRQGRTNENQLRQELFVLRSEIGQFTIDHQRPPDSLSQLVTGGYMKAIPTDPITGKEGTWKFKKAGNLLEVHSGSDGIATDGSRYRSW
jgi:general secretion pathway protein G